MLRKLLVLALLAGFGLVAAKPSTGQTTPPVEQWIPKQAVIVAQVSEPGRLLDLVLDPQGISAVTSLPVYERFSSSHQFQQLTNLVKYLEGRLDVDWQKGLRKLLGGVTFAVGPGKSALLILEAQEAQILEELHEIFVLFGKGEAAKQGDAQRVRSEDYRGTTCWTFNGGKEYHAIVGNRLVLSNQLEALQAVLDLRSGEGTGSMASQANYQAARQAAGKNATGLVFIDFATLKMIPKVQRALAKSSSNPLAALLLAGVADAVRSSNWLALGLTVEGKTLTLQAAVDGAMTDSSGAASFAWPAEPGKGALANLSVPGQIAGLSFYRDLHGFYSAKDQLFPERTSGLIFFENMMGIFFTGRDLTEEVLAETKPETRVVVAEQRYDLARGIPQVKIPSFAAIFHLRDASKFAVIAEEAWQKAVGLVNFTRGQQALPGLIIDRPVHSDIKYTAAYFSSAGEENKTGLDIRYNFRPSIAVAGDYLILSSTDSLVEDLIDSLVAKRPRRKTVPTASSRSTALTWRLSWVPIVTTWFARTWSRKATRATRQRPRLGSC